MPLVSIGMPVFNGEKYISNAIASILDQTFKDFELVICDNHSNDNTENICRKYQSKDNRIKYYRNKNNIGAAPNFNKVFNYSTGAFFKWAAHDDIIHKEFLEKTVDVLDKDPSAVLAYSKSMTINEDGDNISPYQLKLPTDSDNIIERYESLLKFGHKCYEIFGLIRKDILEKTPLMGGYAHGDGVLLTRLSLYGRFVEIPEFLFFPRIHPEHSGTMVGDYHSWAIWFNPKLRNRRIFPYIKMHLEFFKSILATPIHIQIKIRSILILLKYCYNRKDLMMKELFFPKYKIKSGKH